MDKGISTKIIKELEKGFLIVQTDIENWISFWIKDPHGEDVKSFTSSYKAQVWWDFNRKFLLENSDTPAILKARKEARKLVKQMGINFNKLSKEEQDEWIEECL